MASSGGASSRAASSPAALIFTPFRRIGERTRALGSWLTLSRSALLALAATAAGALSGLVMVYLPNPEAVRQLERYEPSMQAVLYDASGAPYGELEASERRDIVTYSEIPEHLRNAILATEDSRFFCHPGIDPIAVLRAAWRNVTRGLGSEGASTLTMQLSRDLWLTKDKALTRKLIEAFYYTLQIERYYSKERIFELYATQMFLGHNVYGFESAAEFYFGNTLDELTLGEAALLAGILQRPNDYRPDQHPAAALRRRAIVLERMVAEGYVSRQEADEAKAEPLVLAEDPRRDELAAYYNEEIRKKLYDTYGGDIYRSGMRVFTTLDPRIQAAAEAALQRQLRVIDKELGWRGAPRNLLDEDVDPATYGDPRWDEPIAAGDVVPAVVLTVAEQRAEVRVADRTVVMTPEQAAWTKRRRMTELLRTGDLVQVEIRSVGEDGALTVHLEQEPELHGAVLVVENDTGEVHALVGGRHFDDSEFNRAVQAKRQTGSAFKPFDYAAALRHGKTASDLMLDSPRTFLDASTRQPYEPRNYENSYVGITTLAEALAKSRNVVAVALQEEIGAENVIETARDLGITANLQPYLSLSLGVVDASLWEMVRAYAVFPNAGVRVEPHLVREVRDREGRTLQRTERQAVQVMSPDVAYLMTRMLVNVIEYCADPSCLQGGTGRRARPTARAIGMPIGGKTGTTDNYSDAWFVGFSPYHTIGVWVGNDTKKPIGPGMEGAKVALPIWQEVMRAAAEGKPPRGFPQPPSGVVLRSVDPRTGLLVGEYCDASIEMAYLEGTEPTAVCGLTEHQILALPYYQQDYFIDNIGAGRSGSQRPR